MTGVDWHAAFVPKYSIELVVRGALMYLAIFVVLRLIFKRGAGEVGLADLLVIVLIADAAQNGMAGEYTSLPDGLVLVATIVAVSWAFDWLGYHVPWFERLVRPRPVLLVENGRLLRKNLRKEMITMEELMGELRKQGCDDLAKVKSVYMEGDGSLSVVQIDGAA
jgi:uncharacterized membrane protein YcaP (DUF421 family)